MLSVTFTEVVITTIENRVKSTTSIVKLMSAN